MPFDNTTGFVTTPQTDLELLRAVREAIAQPGAWVQNQFGFSERHCIAGWVNALTPNSNKSFIELMNKVDSLQLHRGLPWWIRFQFYGVQHGAQVMDYNDYPGRTQDDMVALVDRTIKRLEKRS